MKVILLLFLLVSAGARAQLSLSFDYDNADRTIAFFKQSTARPGAVDSLVHTPGVQVIIQKIRASDSLARITLRKIAMGETLSGKEKDFQYAYIKRQVAAMDSFITSIRRHEGAIRDSIGKLSAYLPAGKKLPVKLCFLMGGYSAGFTLGGADVFYIGTHRYQSDLAAIINTSLHEIFHNLQNLYYNRNSVMNKLDKGGDSSSRCAYYLASNFFTEGSAEWVADIDRLGDSTPFIKDQREHAEVNEYRMADNFFLAESIITTAFRNGREAALGREYSILFDWNWNNPGYAIGKYMTAALVTEGGPDTLKKYLAADPLLFLLDYMALARSKPAKYPYTFSGDFEKVIQIVYEKALIRA